ncbi:uncharacterized protein LOC132163344 [Corylus avellana]|uniref:uncharacterized protein LOC132163344 n=1 Tax=Corylus avellana TaxID=13451 RepID=UPI00286B86EE|nr:uncharacterized protein LOC132163344 [Corylus avellana]
MPQVHQIDDAKGLKATKKAGSMAQSNPIFVYSKECEEGTCAVCLCEFKEAEEVRVLPECLHLFHATCVDSWVNSHSNCPLCRADLKRVRFSRKRFSEKPWVKGLCSWVKNCFSVCVPGSIIVSPATSSNTVVDDTKWTNDRLSQEVIKLRSQDLPQRSKHDEEAGNEKDAAKAKAVPKAAGDGNLKHSKDNSKPPEPPKDDIHVRARQDQATDSHSLAERVRRQKISERMKLLQDLVPGCNKITGKAVMLDEIINYVQSLQRQVEFLSMKLGTVNPRMNFNTDAHLSNDVENLTCKAQLQEVELERTTKQLKEAIAIAEEETTKCKAAEEVIKSLTAQLMEMNERLYVAAAQNVIAPSPNTQLLSNNHKQTHLDATARSRMKESESEYVEQDDPGVYITLTNLPGGVKDLKRVRFSRRRFSEKQAEQWWAENRARVYEQYNVQVIDKSSVRVGSEDLAH